MKGIPIEISQSNKVPSEVFDSGRIERLPWPRCLPSRELPPSEASTTSSTTTSPRASEVQSLYTKWIWPRTTPSTLTKCLLALPSSSPPPLLLQKEKVRRRGRHQRSMAGSAVLSSPSTQQQPCPRPAPTNNQQPLPPPPKSIPSPQKSCSE